MGKVCKKCGSDNTYFTGKTYSFLLVFILSCYHCNNCGEDFGLNWWE